MVTKRSALWAVFISIGPRLFNFWMELRHYLVAVAVFLDGLFIVRSVWGTVSSLGQLFDIQAIEQIDWTSAANGPWLLLGVCLMLSAVGLLFRARVAWAVSIALLMIVIAFTWHVLLEFTEYLYWSLGTLVFLIVFTADFSRSSATAGGIFAAISFIVLLFYSTYGALYFGAGFKPKITDLTDAFYFSMVTMTTVGYGDIIPQTQAARLFTVSIIVAGITVFATSLTTIFGPMLSGGLTKLLKGAPRAMERKNHFIVCGTSVLAVSTILKLKKRGMHVTVLTLEDEDKFPLIEQRVGMELDLLSGDYTDGDLLEEAGMENCLAVLALTDNDANNAFVILSVKEFSPDIKTVIAVNDAKNMHKVKQVKADVVLSPQLFGSEILAAILAGESINDQDLLAMLLRSGEGLVKEKTKPPHEPTA
ncbi:voltage-gated potassium channel protein [Vibrio sp. SM6]|uniref:Voltage-gated potassium channel protein n=1 Tax=Vibrio agarilyticus TaxID=2726741 RepID=A0A7X8TNV2_9VIBR|nr:voltage-gated potassium channel protein [Vibrio agarilyticus]NLS12064.1 voltage-gated potassium channel protein [Vibrio agarilyticus]